MTGEVVSLRRARKRRGRMVAEAEAAANRIAFGQTKHGRSRDEAERALTETRLDEHRIARVVPADDA